jgi:hypothetical protein
MSDTINDMYGSDEEGDATTMDPQATPNGPSIKMENRGAYTEMMVGDQRIRMVDPAYVMQLEARLNTALAQMRAMQEQIKILQVNLRTQHGELKAARRDLDGKVGYE